MGAEGTGGTGDDGTEPCCGRCRHSLLFPASQTRSLAQLWELKYYRSGQAGYESDFVVLSSVRLSTVACRRNVNGFGKKCLKLIIDVTVAERCRLRMGLEVRGNVFFFMAEDRLETVKCPPEGKRSGLIRRHK